MTSPASAPDPAGDYASPTSGFRCFGRNHNAVTLRRDFFAGLTVALFTVPQAMAYALIAGMPPSIGVATAVVASILGAVFGSSEFLINGPTNAIAVMIASNAAILAGGGDLSKSIVLLTLMIGIGQCLAAAIRAGTFTRFVSEPVLTGFTAGAGVYIAINQLAAALGLEKKSLVPDILGWAPPSNCVFDLARTVMSFPKINANALAVSLVCIVSVKGFQSLQTRMRSRVPAPFVTVVLVSLGAYLLNLGDPSQGAAKIKLVQDIEPIRRALPAIVIPEIDLKTVGLLAGPAFAIGLLGAVEAIAIGKSLASRAGHSFSANRQLLGEGACNIGAAFVGGFAASGSFTRTAVNFEAGAVSRFSCIFSGILVLGIVLAFAPLANFIPIPVLAGMLIFIGLKLVNIGKMKLIAQTTRADRNVLIATFLAVLLLPDLAHALFIGVGISVFQALRRAEGFKLVPLIPDSNGHLVEQPETIPTTQVVVLDLQGELFFAAAEVLEEKLRLVLGGSPRILVLRLQQSYNMDLTCAEALNVVGIEAKRLGGRLILSGVRPGMLGTLERAGVTQTLGAESIFEHEPTLLGSTRKAVEFAQKLVETQPESPSARAVATV